MKRTNLLLASLMVASAASMYAQDNAEPKLTVKPTGRILMDGAAYLGGNDNVGADGRFVSGVAIPDVRLGAKASYGNWKAKIDMGFAYGKVGLKDVNFDYKFNDQDLIRAGYFVQQFGLNSSTSSSMKPSMEEPGSNDFFYSNPRLLGAMYVRDMPKYLGTVGVFVEGEAMKKVASEMGTRQGWGVQTRQVWRPFTETGKIAQIGISGNFSSPTYNDKENLNHDSFTYSVNFPTRVSKVTLHKAVIDNAKGSFKFSPELLLASGPVALESQYYYMRVYRDKGNADYVAQGVYGLLRGIISGPSYSYAHADGGLATPAPKSLECVLGYNYLNANDRKANVLGGISNDVSCTFNYYINPYMIARLRYSYTDVRDRELSHMASNRHVNTIQARLQVIF